MENSYDPIALLLCYHISLRYMLMCHKRAVPALDGYWNKMEPLIMSRYVTVNHYIDYAMYIYLFRVLHSRFENVMRMNIESVRLCDPVKFKHDMNPHYVRDHTSNTRS